jgi:tight adherence protein B
MEKDTQALLALFGVLIVALAGIATFVSGAARRAELASRGAAQDDDSLLGRVRRALDRRLRRSAQGQRLAVWLSSAGTRITPADFVLGTTAIALFLWLVFRFLFSPPIALVFAVAITGGVARFYVERLRSKRSEAFVAQLPDLARVLANGASAGLSLPAAVQLAARELPDPAAAEMRVVVQELRVGQPIEDALEALRDRLPSRELGVLMTTLVIQQRAGGDTVRALNELGGTLEARKEVLREVRTVLSGAVYASYIVAGIGIAGIVMMNLLSPGVMRELTSTLPGIIALVVSATLWAIAYVLIRRTTRVTV